MQPYAQERASTLLRRLAFQMNRAARLRDADSIHDLRVVIRRFEQCLKIFHCFFPGAHTRKIHRRLRKIMDLSGDIRNRDIAMLLLKQAGVPPTARPYTRMKRERSERQNQLLSVLDRWNKRDVYRKWGSRLGI
jgi:CHAD domain-containing protein